MYIVTCKCQRMLYSKLDVCCIHLLSLDLPTHSFKRFHFCSKLHFFTLFFYINVNIKQATLMF